MSAREDSAGDRITVSALYVYPLKSARGLSLERATLDDFGFHRDRRWMCVDADGQTVTQRTHPSLARVSLRDAGTHWTLHDDRDGSVGLPYDVDAGVVRPVYLWGTPCDAIDGAPDASALLSAALRARVRVVFMPDSSWRAVPASQYAGPRRLAFTDDNPLLLTSVSSLEAVNAGLPERIPIDRFRANIVITGAAAWDEDRWRSVSIGHERFTATNRCGRCVVITTDQHTGARGPEPLASMRTHRLLDGRIRFGRNLVHETFGTVHVGDAVRGA